MRLVCQPYARTSTPCVQGLRDEPRQRGHAAHHDPPIGLFGVHVIAPHAALPEYAREGRGKLLDKRRRRHRHDRPSGRTFGQDVPQDFGLEHALPAARAGLHHAPFVAGNGGKAQGQRFGLPAAEAHTATQRKPSSRTSPAIRKRSSEGETLKLLWIKRRTSRVLSGPCRSRTSKIGKSCASTSGVW